MKNLVFTLLLLAVICAACKEEDKPEINSCGEEVTHGGIGKSQETQITFWIRKPYGCGNIRVVKILNKSNGSTEYTAIVPTITKYFPTGPICRETGAALLKVVRGYTYEYTFACDTKAWRAEFTAACDDKCQFVELLEPVN